MQQELYQLFTAQTQLPAPISFLSQTHKRTKMRLYQAAECTLGPLIIPLVGLLVQELAVMLFPAVLMAERHCGTNGASNHLPVGLRNVSDLAKFTLDLKANRVPMASQWPQLCSSP